MPQTAQPQAADDSGGLERTITGRLLFAFVLGDVLGSGIYVLVGAVAGEPSAEPPCTLRRVAMRAGGHTRPLSHHLHHRLHHHLDHLDHHQYHRQNPADLQRCCAGCPISFNSRA